MAKAAASRSSAKKETPKKTTAGAVPAEALEGDFPAIDLPVRPPFPPMEARAVDKIPGGGGWLYEPKWDGFRCLAFRKGDQVLLQSKSCQPLGRYFPELVEALRALPVKTFALDGEIVIFRRESDGALSFDDLLLRIHPAESRIRKLARETPSSLLAFDLLVDDRGRSLAEVHLEERRPRLERLFEKLPEGGSVTLSPATPDHALAQKWIRELGGAGLDGVVAKRLDAPYMSGDRSAMVKIKRMRTADCVVGGFRWAQAGGKLGSLLLGFYNEAGLLDHVGFSSSFNAAERGELEEVLKPHIGGSGFTGKAPGGPSRWAQGRSTEWVALDPVLVCEVRYDHFSGGRFRHGTRFLRWRPDKEPRACTYEQVRARGGAGALRGLGLAG
jgi:ATP-dependent DNA ligase